MKNKKEPIDYPEKFYAKIVQVGDSEGIVIPYQILQANNWKKGDNLAIWLKKLITKKEEE